MEQHAEIQYNGISENKEYEEIINKVLNECFKNEGLTKLKLYISITLTVPEEIQKINKQYRNIDKPTDVLSFPMFQKEELEKLMQSDYPVEDVLGDIIISIPKVEEQAAEYGHSFERELAYMTVHGFYHLMGYDHISDNEKKEMRKKEDEILNKLHITRGE
mgnify:CR=1 FL=1